MGGEQREKRLKWLETQKNKYQAGTYTMVTDKPCDLCHGAGAVAFHKCSDPRENLKDAFLRFPEERIRQTNVKNQEKALQLVLSRVGSSPTTSGSFPVKLCKAGLEPSITVAL